MTRDRYRAYRWVPKARTPDPVPYGPILVILLILSWIGAITFVWGLVSLVERMLS